MSARLSDLLAPPMTGAYRRGGARSWNAGGDCPRPVRSVHALRTPRFVTFEDQHELTVEGSPPRSSSGSVSAPPTDVALDEARALLEEAESELRKIEHAIEGLGLGTHASCAICGAAIEPERLMSSPTARRCAAHAEQS